jgi:hypothetical protein
MPFDEDMVGEGALHRVEITDENVDLDVESLGAVVTTVGRYHQIGGGEVRKDLTWWDVATGEDDDGPHRNHKIVLRALTRVRDNPQVEVDGGDSVVWHI